MADFRINVIVDPSGARRGTRSVDRELGRTENRARRLGNALRSAFAVVGLGVGLTQGISLLAGFGQEMSTVQAVTQATQEEFQQLSDAAQSLGTNTRFSASQAAEGMTFLARAGFDAAEVLGTIEGTLQLAQAGALGLGQAADIASNVLTGFRLETDQTARVVDVLALASNSANTNVAQLGTAMSFVAPVAAGLGLEVETATAAIGALSNAGIQGSSAGTGLRRVLSTLESPIGKVAEIFEKLVGDTENVRVSQVGLVTALQRLRDAGVDTGLALELFGDRGGPAFEVLSNAIPDIIELEAQLQNADGTAARIAATMDDNLNGALLSVRSAFEGVIIAAGEGGVTSTFRGLFETLAGGLRLAAENIDVVIGGVESLATFLAINLARQAIPAAIAGVRALTIAIATNPFGVLAVGAAAAISLLVGFRDEINLSSDSIASFSDLAVVSSEAVQVAFDGLGGQIADTFSEAASSGDGLFRSLEFNVENGLLFFASFADTTKGIFVGLFNGASSLFTNLPAVVAEAGVDAQNFLLRSVAEVSGTVVGTFRAISGTISAVIFQISMALNGLGQASRSALTGDFESATQQAAESVNGLRENVGTLFSQFGDRSTREINRGIVQIADSLGVADNQFRGAGERASNEFLDAYSEGFTQTGAVDFVTRLLGEAEDRAADRQRQRFVDAQNQAKQAREAAEDAAQAVENVAGPDTDTGAREAQGTALQGVLDRLTEEGQLLRLNARDREVANQLLEIESDLREQNIMLSDAERAQVETRLQANQALADQAAILEQIRGPQEELQRTQEALNALYAEGAITANEYNRAILEIEASAGRLAGTLEGGFAAGLAQAQLNLMDVSSLAENTVVNAFQGAEDALVSFAQTGEFNFSGLVDSILADLLRLTARQALGGLVGLLGGGGGGGGLGGLLGGLFGRQDGGAVQSGNSFLVGEQGPELFTPPQDGTIVPADQTAGMFAAPAAAAAPIVTVMPPEVNVRVVNVQDPNEIPEAIESPEGEQAILNVIRRNRSSIRELTA